MENRIIKSPVTYLEVRERPDFEGEDLNDYEFILQQNPDVDEYLKLYKEIGRDYIWNYRPGQTRNEIQELIRSPNTQLYVLADHKKLIGMGECDLSDPKNVEIVHFGLLPEYVGIGLGKKFFSKLLDVIWQASPNRIFLSTCGLDHPKAKIFYQNAGFKIFKTKEGEFIDYRYSDFYSIDDAPEIPHDQEWVDRQS